MNPVLPRITLITPSYQQARYLEECLASVHDQGYPNLEHIVVDGGSTDGSIAIIERYADKLAWWCSEPDNGQSHAINKGLEHATGSVFGWLNSDDVLLPGALQRVGEAFAVDATMNVLTGARITRDPEGNDTRLPTDDPLKPDTFFTAPKVNQQSTFYRMEAVQAVHRVEERLRYVMDYELWLQVLFTQGSEGVRVVPWDLAVFRHHPESKTSTQQPRFLDEIASVLHGACLRTGHGDLMEVLALGHTITPGLRALPVDGTHAILVRRMTIAFLLKWHHLIYSARDFHMMKRLCTSVGLRDEPLENGQRRLAEQVEAQVRVPGWWAFRLRRKWEHLAG